MEEFYAANPEAKRAYNAALAYAETPALPGQELRKLHGSFTMGDGVMYPMLVPPFVEVPLQSGEKSHVRFTHAEMKSGNVGLNVKMSRKIRDFVMRPESNSDENPYGYNQLTIPGYNRGFIINDELNEGIKESYDDNDLIKGSVPIYFVVYVGVATHLSLIVHYGGRSYSLGLGFVGAKSKSCGIKKELPVEFISKAGFYSPDYLVKPCGVTSKGELFSYKLVDFGAFTRMHADRILEYNVDTSQGVTLDLTGPSMYIPLTATYSKVSNRILASKEYVNCTSFLASIFRERIDCSTVGVDIPWKCESVAKSVMGGKSMTEMFNLFIEEYKKKETSGEMKTFLDYQKAPSYVPSIKTIAVVGGTALLYWAAQAAIAYFSTRGDDYAGGRRTRKMKSRRAKTRRNRRN
jgi:hypothetical protein